MEQLKEVLREVLKEELAPVTGRLDSLETRFDGLESQVLSIQKQLDRLERTQAGDVVSILQVIDNKLTIRLDRHEHQISVINDRLLAVEADLRKLQTS
jgi:chaperonin cofactor prefoldin